MNIAHVIFSLNTGGSETMLVDIVNEQCESHNIALLIVNSQIDYTLLHQVDNRVMLCCTNRTPGSKSIFPLLKLNQFLLRFKPKIIHCHNHNSINAFLPVFKKRAFLTLHTTDIPANNLFKYQRLFAISKSVSIDVEERTNIKTKIIYNGVSIASIKQKKFFYINNEFNILQIGRLEHNIKGQDILIKAISRLKKLGYLNIRVSFIGSGKSLEYLTELCKKEEITEMVTFRGHVRRDEIYKIIRNFDLVVQPSLVEGFGLTVAEALVAKTPVLISNLPGPMEVIDYGKHGDYFELNNVDSLAEKIIEIILSDKALLLERLEKAYEHSAKQFDIKNTANSYLREYATYAN